jgi:steroid delta-isomerase-like uncharacterized protein
MSIETNKAILGRLEQVFNQHDVDALGEVFHVDYVELDPPPGMGPGLAGLQAWMAMFFAAFPDLRWTLEEQIGEGDKVASRSTWQGTHQGPFLGIPATGKPVTVAAWTIDQVADGKIAASRIIMDVMGLLQQLGAIPTPEQPGV